MPSNGFDFCEVSRRLIAARTKKGYTQEQLANELGVSLQTIKKYEKAASPNVQDMPGGSRDNSISGMRMETLWKLSELLGVSADYLLGWTDIESVDCNVRSAQEYTGLSEAAVNKLHSFSLMYEPPGYLDLLSLFIADNGIEQVLEYFCGFVSFSIEHPDSTQDFGTLINISSTALFQNLANIEINQIMQRMIEKYKQQYTDVPYRRLKGQQAWEDIVRDLLAENKRNTQ